MFSRNYINLKLNEIFINLLDNRSEKCIEIEIKFGHYEHNLNTKVYRFMNEWKEN